MPHRNKSLSRAATTRIHELFHTDHMPAQFLVVTFISPDNEMIASYSLSGLDEDTTTVPLETTKRIFGNPESQDALHQMQETVFYDLDGRRLVCRPMIFEDDLYLLIVLTKAKVAYRRDLNQIYRKIVEAVDTD